MTKVTIKQLGNQAIMQGCKTEAVSSVLTYPTLAGRHRRMHAKTRTCGIQVPGNTGDTGCWGRSLVSL